MSLYHIWSWWPASPPEVCRAEPADAEAMAAIHGASFHRGWGAEDFSAMLADRAVLAHVVRRRAGAPVCGFILSRLATDEAEILSVALAPRLRGRGFAARLLEAHVRDLVRAGVATLFLEVEAGNEPALRLYRRHGFEQIGRRKGYYRGESAAADALTMRRTLPPIG